jgi:3' terminal RNA ribose 2'-O-methyltransferase Hen1
VLLTITTTCSPATDLGYLLHKNPDRLQTFDLAFGHAHIFYPEATRERCTAALLLEIDPVGLVRRPRGSSGEGFALEQYVNDRPYAASSFLSVAIAQVFSSAMSGRCKDRPGLAATPIPLEARIAALPCRGGESILRRLFEPLGYRVEASGAPLDSRFPDWGESRYFTVRLQGIKTLSDLLSHLYVLIPVLDNDKHYWVGEDEVEKLLRRGRGWLAEHPEREEIIRRYLKHRRSLARVALQRLMGDEEPDPEESDERKARDEEALEEKISLNDQRLGTVLAVVRSFNPKKVIDLGCGEGRLVKELLGEKEIDLVAGMDVSHRALEIASDRVHLDRMTDRQKKRLQLFQGSLTYRDPRLSGYDVATAVEVIEHLEPGRMGSFERVVFENAKPGAVVLTTPNAEYNVKFEQLPAGRFRHRDHRFEWTRPEFRAWADGVGSRFGYSVRCVPVGPEDAQVGPPTQMAVFTR